MSKQHATQTALPLDEIGHAAGSPAFYEFLTNFSGFPLDEIGRAAGSPGSPGGVYLHAEERAQIFVLLRAGGCTIKEAARLLGLSLGEAWGLIYSRHNDIETERAWLEYLREQVPHKYTLTDKNGNQV